MAKRKRSEHSQESKKQKKKSEREDIGLREEVSLMDEQVRLDQLEKRLESKVFLFSDLLPLLNFLRLLITYHLPFVKFHKLPLSSQFISLF